MPSSKLIGEIAEMEFHSRCARLGLRSTRGIGEFYPYDAIVDNGHSCLRVQVKATEDLGCKGLYQVHSGHSVYGRGIVAYEEGKIDFFASYLFRVNTWYIVPLSATARRLCVTLYAPYRRHKGKYSQYFEAWRPLKKRKPCPFCLQASADPDYPDPDNPPNPASPDYPSPEQAAANQIAAGQIAAEKTEPTPILPAYPAPRTECGLHANGWTFRAEVED